MPSRTRQTRQESYRWQTHRPINCLAFVFPLLIAFHVGAAVYGTRLLAPRDLFRLLRFFGGTWAYLPAVMIVAVLLVQHLFHRDPWKPQPRVLAGMVVESVVWTFPLIVLSHLSDRFMSQLAAPPAADAARTTIESVVVSLGAGIYEEFVFRLMLVSLALLLFVDVFELKKDYVLPGAVIVSAVLFALYHFTGQQLSWAGFPWGSFVFLTGAGVYLGGVYAARGYAVAVGVHALYDVYALAWVGG